MHTTSLTAIRLAIRDIRDKDRTQRPLPKSFVCGMCDMPAEHYMVHDHVWGEAFNVGAGIRCIPCLTEALGRKLTYEDFKPTPINLSILTGMMMGAEA